MVIRTRTFTVAAQLGFVSAQSANESQHSSQLARRCKSTTAPSNTESQLSIQFVEQHLNRAEVLFGEEEQDDSEQPPDFINLSKLYILAQHQYACSMLLRHFLGYLFFLLLIAIVIMLQRDAVTTSGLRSAMSNCFLFNAFRDEGTNELTGWFDIADFHDFWKWHLGPFLLGFYQDAYGNGNPRSLIDRQLAQVPMEILQRFPH